MHKTPGHIAPVADGSGSGEGGSSLKQTSLAGFFKKHTPVENGGVTVLARAPVSYSHDVVKETRMRDRIAEAARSMGDILEIVDESHKSGPKTASNQAKIEHRTKALAKMRRDMELYPEDRWLEVIYHPAEYLEIEFSGTAKITVFSRQSYFQLLHSCVFATI
jgi:hypothetical protein